jgi:hypothetical protein
MFRPAVQRPRGISRHENRMNTGDYRAPPPAMPWNLPRRPSILSPRRRIFPRASPSEVRLPQGLRFTDVRRSTIGDYPVARCGPRAPKSHGRPELRPLSRLLHSLRLPSAAAFLCANLRCLLDGIFRPERSFVRALRGLAG